MDYNKYTIKQCDMPDDMKKFVLRTFNEGNEKFKNEKEICSYIKLALDKEYLPTWHCFIGREFASHVTYDPGTYLHFLIGNHTVLVFKCG
ncbi:Dynein light chain [Paragonimus heterotremus]|uniref:Dynein light chain n=1 Tax=Paragonimus heterotremus TaxID=100268 RepID=A0A8J4WK47_9TREM|nr:Dynein light chain [Paragonimus heterotremus]